MCYILSEVEMNKQDYIWLTRNTDIDNVCDFEDCMSEKIVFKLFRKHHLPEIKRIFCGHDTQVYTDEDNSLCLEVKDMTISEFCEIAMNYNSDIIYNAPNGRCYYDPADRKKYEHIFRLSTPQQLNRLSDEKKLDILMALNKDCYRDYRRQKLHDESLNRNAAKLNILLQISFPAEFWEREQRKVRLITAEVAKLPHIKEKLQDFHKLSESEKANLFKQACEITAKYNGIEKPKVNILTDEEVEKYTDGNEWVNPEAFASGSNVFVNESALKKLSGIQVMALAWHETNHIAMAKGDYSHFPTVEDKLNARLDYINNVEQSYIFHPQEKINYALEKQFIEELTKRSGVRADDVTLKMQPEYAVAIQYMMRSLQKFGR